MRLRPARSEAQPARTVLAIAPKVRMMTKSVAARSGESAWTTSFM